MGLLRTFYKNALINSQLSLYTVEMKNTRGWRARDAGFQLIIDPHCRVTGNLYLCLRLEYIKKRERKAPWKTPRKGYVLRCRKEGTHYMVFYFLNFLLFHLFSLHKSRTHMQFLPSIFITFTVHPISPLWSRCIVLYFIGDLCSISSRLSKVKKTILITLYSFT